MLRSFPGLAPDFPPPAAPREPVTIEQIGRTRTDPYAWMKAANWREVMRDASVLDARIRDHLEAENAWTHAQLETPTAELRDALFLEMRGRIKEDESSVPVVDGPWAYYRRFRDGGEYPVFARRPAASAFDASAAEEVLIDGDAMGAEADYFDIRRAEHSPDHRLFAYAVDDQGSEFYSLRVRDLAAGADLTDRIDGCYGDFAWSADSRAIYWVERDANARPTAVFRRVLGSGEDELVYREPDPGFFVGVHRSLSGRFIFIVSRDHTTSEWRVFPADAETPAPRVIALRERDVDYSVVDWGNRFVVRTNSGGAVDFRLCETPLDVGDGDAPQLTEITPHRPGVLLLDVMAFRDHLVRLERAEGLPRLVVRERASGEEHTVAFGEAAYSIAASAGLTYDTTTLRFDYSSPATPSEVYDYDMAQRTRILRKRQTIPSGHDPNDYVVERVMAPAADGASIPVSILRRTSTPLDGSAPLLLYGYGAYGITIPADFRTARLSLVDRGFIYAIAHVRGSTAKGYQWYLDGKLDRKANTFTDFLAAAEHLTRGGYSSRGRVIAMGGSAGGMLVGAVVNLDPLMFAGAIAAVPFVDVLNTMSDEDLPLTPPEWPEWGNPLQDPAAYDAIAAYSPYDQTGDKPYPPLLVTGGLSDPRVTYWEPAKWVARLRAEAPDGGPYFLKINMEAGHGGASGRFSGLRETALEFAFAVTAAQAAGARLAPIAHQNEKRSAIEP